MPNEPDVVTQQAPARGQDQMGVNLAQWRPVQKWVPHLGDFVIWHGWFSHWFGVVAAIDAAGTVSVIKAGLPSLVFHLRPEEMEKHTVKLPRQKIERGNPGEWSVLQQEGPAQVWYV